MVIIPENFRMIQWQEHCQQGVTDGQTDGQTEISVLRAAWSQLKKDSPQNVWIRQPYIVLASVTKWSQGMSELSELLLAWCFSTWCYSHHFPDIFKCIFLNEDVRISIEISLKFVPRGPINNIPSLVQIMAWRRHLNQCWLVYWRIYVTRPEWVNIRTKYDCAILVWGVIIYMMYLPACTIIWTKNR